jgi:hypothetical protein
LRRACLEFANGEWRMANGDGKWQMANDEWRMANGEWRMANDEAYVDIDGDGDGDDQDKGENEGNDDGGGQIPVRNPAGLLKAENKWVPLIRFTLTTIPYDPLVAQQSYNLSLLMRSLRNFSAIFEGDPMETPGFRACGMRVLYEGNRIFVSDGDGKGNCGGIHDGDGDSDGNGDGQWVG